MKRRRTTAAVLVLLAVAAALRIWGIDFGLPYALEARPDEREIVQAVVHFFEGDFNPHRFHYPSLFYYLLFVCDVAFVAVGKLTGSVRSFRDLPFIFVAGPNALHVVARLLSAGFGVATVYVTWRLGRRAVGRRAGFLAALFMAVAYLHVRDSHFGVTDVAMTFFCALSLLPILSVLESGGRGAYVLAGLSIGLGVSTKYNAALLALPLVAAHLLHGKRARWPRLVLAGVVAAGAFLCATPFAVLDFKAFWGDLHYELFVHGQEGHVLSVGLGWWRHPWVSLRYGLGGPMCLAAAAGGVWLLLQRPKVAAVVLALPAAYYLVLGPRHTVFVRYALPMAPAAALCAGYGCSELVRLCRSKGLGAAAVLAVLLPTTVRATHLDAMLCRSDTRNSAAEWIEAHLSPSDMVGWVGTKYTIASPPSELRARTRVQKVVHSVDTIEQLRELHPRFVVTCGHSALGHFCKVPRDMAEWIGRHYRLAAVISAEGAETHRDVYDVQDAFFVPYAGFRGVTRPGPEIRIYRGTAPGRR